MTALKTKASRAALPLPKEVEELLLAWRAQTAYREASDWVFASPMTGGKRPYWPTDLEAKRQANRRIVEHVKREAVAMPEKSGRHGAVRDPNGLK